VQRVLNVSNRGQWQSKRWICNWELRQKLVSIINANLNYPLLSVIFLNTQKGQSHLLSKQFLITRFKVSSLKLLIERCPRGGPLILMWILPICLTLLSRSFHFSATLCTLHPPFLSLPLYLFAANTSSNLCTSLPSGYTPWQENHYSILENKQKPSSFFIFSLSASLCFSLSRLASSQLDKVSSGTAIQISISFH